MLQLQEYTAEQYRRHTYRSDKSYHDAEVQPRTLFPHPYLVAYDVEIVEISRYDAGADRDYRHQNAVGQVVENVKQILARDIDHGKRTESQRRQCSQYEHYTEHDRARRESFQFTVLAQHRHDRLGKRYRRRQRREKDQYEEHRAYPPPSGYVVEHRRELHEHQRRPRLRSYGFGIGRKRVNRRNDDERGDYGKKRIANRYLPRGAGNARVLFHIRAVRDHDTHRQRHRIEQLPECSQKGFVRKITEIGDKEFFHAFPRSGLTQHIDHQEYRKYRKRGHQYLAHSLDALLNAEHYDQYRSRAEYQKIYQRLPRVGRERREKLR